MCLMYFSSLLRIEETHDCVLRFRVPLMLCLTHSVVFGVEMCSSFTESLNIAE